ncbi:MAG: sulfatase-like hydrolase/transferase [Actinomycetota bacterium]
MALVASLMVVSADATAIGRASKSKSVTAGADAPNILIIVTDDQRPDTMSFMPWTQRLFGRQGVRFERAFATTPLCCPFRASLMTGQYAHNSAVRRNGDARKLNHEHTLQRYLYEGGYRTALLGKFLNTWPREDPPPYFERFVLGTGYYGNRPVNVDGKMKVITQYLPYFLRKRAVRILENFERDDTTPWMMVLTPSSPHGPTTPAPEHRGVRIPKWEGNPANFEEDLSDKPPMLYPNNTPDGVEARLGAKTHQRAAKTLLGADTLVNDVFNSLRELDEDSNTLAFFMSDNGFLMGEHGLRLKRFPYPMSQEIPLHMRWPDGGVPRGATDDRLAANIDILPTVLEAAGLEDSLEHEVDGLSLRGSERRDRLLLEHFADNRRQVPTWGSLITDREQYTEYYQLDGETKVFTEYYDVLSDPWRLTNTLGDDDPRNDPHAPTIQELSDQLKADRRCAGANCP